MDVRSLKEDPGLSDEVRRLLNAALFRDFLDRRFFRKLTREDPNFDPKLALVGVERGSVVAAALGVERVREPPEVVEQQKEVAWIKALAARRDNLASLEELIAALESELASRGRKQVRVSDYASWYLAPGVDVEYEEVSALLERLGYVKVGEAVNYEVDMSAYYTPSRIAKVEEKLRSEGLTLRWVEASDAAELLRWIGTTFSPFWRTEAEMALKAEDGGVLVAEEGSSTIGFSVYGALRPDYFGPVGVDPKKRGRGVGTVLLFKTLQRMREEGVRVATIPWTTHLTYYAQVPGVYRVRLFTVMAKTIG